MARAKAQVPARRIHVSGQSVVTIDGTNFYLGPHKEAKTLARYAVLIQAYQENGSKLPDGFSIEDVRALTDGLFGSEVASANQTESPVLLRHVTAGYREHAKTIYGRNSPSEYKRLLALCDELDQTDGNMLAREYGPRSLRKQRERWVASGKARVYCNRLTNTVLRMFRWAVSEELVMPDQLVGLRSLAPLRIGQTIAPETDEVKPVAIEVVRATVKHLSPVVRTMVRVQIATGMRPSELFRIRPCDIDKAGPEWVYRPPDHKNKSKGKLRAIPIVGDAREALENYLNRRADAFCFSPKEAMAWHQAVKRANRKSKVQPSQRDRSKPDAKRKPRDCYNAHSYRRAIVRAAETAKVASWHPYQLRHLNLTEIRDLLGVEHAQAMAGHSNIRMTEHYAKLNERKAIEAARHAPTLGGDI